MYTATTEIYPDGPTLSLHDALPIYFHDRSRIARLVGIDRHQRRTAHFLYMQSQSAARQPRGFPSLLQLGWDALGLRCSSTPDRQHPYRNTNEPLPFAAVRA